MPQDYPVPACPIQIEYEVKKSRFIARLAYADSRSEALSHLEQARQNYPDARHHCWAYLIGHPHQPNLVAMSDDGEPSGTAGKPILNVMQHKPLGDCMLIVVRYFGGIKLGAGGLVRAYSQAAQQVYDHVETRQKVFLNEHLLTMAFSEEQTIRHWLNQHQGLVKTLDYNDQVHMTIALPDAHTQALAKFVSQLSQCQIVENNKPNSSLRSD